VAGDAAFLMQRGDHEEACGARDGVGAGALWSAGAPTFGEADADPDPASLVPDAAGIVQVKVWLLGIGPMVWRRVLVPDTCTLREPHGVIQVAMGWEGVHLYQFCLRSRRYGSWKVSASSPAVTLAALKLRRGLRRHPERARLALLAFWCAPREAEVVDGLVEPLIQVTHRITVKAERRVVEELVEEAREVRGKAGILFRIAEAAVGTPDGVVREVIFPVAGEQTFEALVREARALGAPQSRRAHTAVRASCGSYYRRMMPRLLAALDFRSDNGTHRPLPDAIEAIRRAEGEGRQFFGAEEIAIEGVVRPKWRDIVLEDAPGGGQRMNRINYEICALQTLRERLRCKEVWAAGAGRFRNPDEDLPADFAGRRAACYERPGLPTKARAFTDTLRAEMTGHGRRHRRSGGDPAPLHPQQRAAPDLQGPGRTRQGGQDRVPVPLPRRGGAAARDPRGAERGRDLEFGQRLHLLRQGRRGGRQPAGRPGGVRPCAAPAAALPDVREPADVAAGAGRACLDGAHDVGRHARADAIGLEPRQRSLLRSCLPRVSAFHTPPLPHVSPQSTKPQPAHPAQIVRGWAPSNG